MLRMREVKRRVNLVEDIHGCRFELEEGHDEGEGNEGATLPTERERVSMANRGNVQLECVLGGVAIEHNVPLTATKLCQTSLPDASKPDFDLQTFREVLTFWRLEFGKIAR
jgi:hypothetical protein